MESLYERNYIKEKILKLFLLIKTQFYKILHRGIVLRLFRHYSKKLCIELNYTNIIDLGPNYFYSETI